MHICMQQCLFKKIHEFEAEQAVGFMGVFRWSKERKGGQNAIMLQSTKVK